MGAAQVIEQHVIDPEICIRCNTCEATCPVGAVTHDERNYVVDADICNHCMACLPPCPTGSIDNWRTMLKVKAYSVAEQLTWDELPPPVSAEELPPIQAVEAAATPLPVTLDVGSTLPPWSAAHPYTNLYGPKTQEKYVIAKVGGNVRVTAVGTDYDTHHIVLDFEHQLFPVLEGQSIGIIAPGVDASGRTHHARQYSVASPRDGERCGYNNVSLTVKRVLEDHSGQPVRGVASNYLCDLKVGDSVKVIGPFGASFLMPNHPGSHLVMICTGTGSAPMRAMTEWRCRQLALDKASGKSRFEQSQLKLFFGARTAEELPYFGPLKNLPKAFIDIHFALSRAQDQPKRYVQDLMLEQSKALLPLIKDPQAYFYVCGLKAMEEGVLAALQKICQDAGEDWLHMSAAMTLQGRLHLETY
jgi:benzoyl-CoA 2,3-epoxidase subunit A